MPAELFHSADTAFLLTSHSAMFAYGCMVKAFPMKKGHGCVETVLLRTAVRADLIKAPVVRTSEFLAVPASFQQQKFPLPLLTYAESQQQADLQSILTVQSAGKEKGAAFWQLLISTKIPLIAGMWNADGPNWATLCFC